MRSKASIKSHPLHPILVGFPIALYTATFICDLLLLSGGNDEVRTTAYYANAAAVISALVAAVPGLIDLLHTVPPRSSAKKRGVRHGLLNVTVVALFSIAWALRRNEDASYITLVLLEGPGMVLMLVAGWMGGTLVHRNGIGVDPRYAFAGKWKERKLDAASGRIELGAAGALKRDQMMLLHAGDRRLVLAQTEKGPVLFDDRCTHRGGSLAGGALICGTVQCPWHGTQFDVHTGVVKAGPGAEPIQTYPVTEEGGKLYAIL